MKFISLLALLLVSAVALANGDPNAPNACRFDDCKLPNCRCSSYNIPGDLALKDTPQFVTVSFPGSVNVNNIVTYRDILYNRVNSNGCPVGATFFVNHEYNNYVLVNELYNRGFEIGLSSITHQTPKTYWQEATYDVIKREIVDQRLQMAHFANIPLDSIKGVRLPFLQLAGNNSFQVMADYGLEYDYTWVHTLRANPAPWPHTLDYRSTLRCDIPPCPTASIPGVWIKPLISWFDQRGTPCSTLDACYFVPDYENEEKWFLFILNNFQTHYFGNRAPFSFFVNESFLTTFPAVRRAFVRFMDVINNLEDVFTLMSTRDKAVAASSKPTVRLEPALFYLSTISLHTGCNPVSTCAHEYTRGWTILWETRHNLPYRCNSCKPGSTVDTTMKTPEHLSPARL
ncbi:hypothetical protein SFRURICE_013146, partial [Spodoptera frugiperda]